MDQSLPAACIFLGAGFVQGLTGFGSALVAVPLLSLFLDIRTVVPLCMLNSVVITTYMAWNLRAHLAFGRILPLFAGSLPGIVLGTMVLKHLDEQVLRTLIGMLLAGYGIYSLLARPRSLGLGRGWGLLAGFCTGAIGSAFSAGGPPTIIYTTLTDWSRDEIRATLTGFFLTTSYITSTVHAINGVTTSRVVAMAAVTAPAVFLGTVLGARLARRIGRRGYLRIVYCLLVLLGVMMLAR